MIRLAPLLLLAQLASVARADPCEDQGGHGPARAPVRDTGLDVARPVCPEDAVFVDLRGYALVDTDDFYGTLSASALVGLRVRRERLELEGGARVLDYRFAQNAVVTARELAIGPVWLALTRVHPARLLGRGAAWSWTGRLEVPGSDLGYGITTGAAAVSLQGVVILGEGLQLLGRMAALGWLAAPIDDPEARGAVAAALDFGWRPGARVGLTAGAEVQGGWYGASLDHLLVRGGGSLRLGRFRLELAIASPLAGAERTDLVIVLGLARSL
ncbi:MAG TPA: hypothetical protein VML75_22455 [Kofleriaceae bacterium]|nr:hypothetical protein [Kofleriaceae bacterium]